MRCCVDRNFSNTKSFHVTVLHQFQTMSNNTFSKVSGYHLVTTSGFRYESRYIYLGNLLVKWCTIDVHPKKPPVETSPSDIV